MQFSRESWQIAVLGPCLLLLVSSRGGRALSQQPGPAPTPAEDLQAATRADKAGDYAAAAKHFQRFLDRVDPSQMKAQDMTEVRTRLGTLYFLLHEYHESLLAVAPLTSAKMPSAPVPPQAWLVQGLDELEINQVPEAIRALQQALNLNPESGTTRLALGDALARDGNLAGAIDQYQEQLRRTPSEGEAWYKLGLAYAFLTKETSNDFWARYPKDPLGQQLKAEGSISRGNYTEALRTLVGLVGENASETGLHADLGMALLNLGFPQTAEAQFLKELKHDPDSPGALFGMSVIKALGGDWEEVRRGLRLLEQGNPRELARLFESSPPIVLRQALQQDRLIVPADFADSPLGAAWVNWLHEADVDLSAVKPSAQGQCLEQLDPASLEPGAWLSEVCYRQLAEKVLRHTPSTLSNQQDKLAEAELRDGDFAKAEADAKQAHTARPADGWATYWLVQSYEALGYAAFRKVSELNPNSARLHQMMAKYYSDKHETSHAVAEFEEAIKLSPNLPDLYLGLGTVYWEAGDWDQAEGPLRRALDLSPALLPASYELGDVYVQRRQWDAAIRYLQPAKGDATLNYKVCLDLSKAEAGLGHTQGAINDLLPLASQDADGEVHYRLALLYRKLGDAARAQAAFAASNQLRQASLQHGQEVLDTMEKERQALDESNH